MTTKPRDVGLLKSYPDELPHPTSFMWQSLHESKALLLAWASVGPNNHHLALRHTVQISLISSK